MRPTRYLAALAAAVILPLALAHATVRTEMGVAESKAGASETYRLNVPVEKDVPTTSVRMVVPDGFAITRFQQLNGWLRSEKRDADGRVTEVTWRGRLGRDEFQRFVFQGRNPAEPATLVWKVYQAYADGTVVAWDDSSPDTPASRVTIK